MANPHRGEATFTVEGVAYKAVFSTNAFCIAENALDLGTTEIVARLLLKGRVGDARVVLWAALQEHHPDLTLEDVGGLIDALGQEETGAMIGKGVSLAMPALVKAKPGSPARPRPAAAPNASGTGRASSKAGSRKGSTRTRSGARPPG